MAVCSGRKRAFGWSPSRAGRIFSIAVVLLTAGVYSLQRANAIGDTRTISLHHVHTNEDITITYMRNGRYDDAALQKLNWFLRDWRRNEQVTMDPYLIDLLWEIHREVGAKSPIFVVCGYRSPETNALLRARSSGVALFSQHISGHATDFFIPGVPVEDIRVAALRLQGGGVGYYPDSSSHFVHVDTGNVRHWPRMTREELARVFPDGRTLHIPSDGRPLAGYALALAEVERQGKLNPFAKLVRGEEPDVAAVGSIRPTQTPLVRQASLVSPAMVKAPVAVKTPPLPVSRPLVVEVGKVPSPPGSKTVTVNPRPTAMASMFSPWPTAPVDRVSPELALAYAAHNEPAQRVPLANVQRSSLTVPAPAPTAKRSAWNAPSLREIGGTVPLVTANSRADNPWLRAVLLAPSMYHFMTTTQFNQSDARQYAALMRKPSSVLAMGFSADPYDGMTANAFTGKAVQFMATVSFEMRTAALH